MADGQRDETSTKRDLTDGSPGAYPVGVRSTVAGVDETPVCEIHTAVPSSDGVASCGLTSNCMIARRSATTGHFSG